MNTRNFYSLTLGCAAFLSESPVTCRLLMDGLAAYRSSSSTGTSYSIQVGTWASQGNSEELVDDIAAIPGMSYGQGIPLLLTAFDGAQLPSVLVLAKTRFGLLRNKALYSSDPYFQSVLNSAVPEENVKSTPRVASSNGVRRPAKISVPTAEKFVASSLQKILGLTPSDVENLGKQTTFFFRQHEG